MIMAELAQAVRARIAGGRLFAAALVPVLVASLSLVATPAQAAPPDAAAARYDIGQPVVQDLWVDPLGGDDANGGTTRSQPLRSLDAAWQRVPMDQALGSGAGYRINLLPGDYAENLLPAYMERRYGSAEAPIMIQASDGPRTVRLHGYLNLFDVHYLYLLNLDVVTDPGYGGGGNALHLERGDHVLLRGVHLDGFDGTTRQPQETLKVNQSQYVYVEDSEITGAFWFPLDYMAVQVGHIMGSSIHGGDEDCLLLKGGTVGIRVEANEVWDCGIGLAAGQGSGLEYMVAPWLRYDAYDLVLVNNLVHDTRLAGLAVRGGSNILAAFNTFARVGTSEAGSGLLLIAPGMRGCDGDSAACAVRHDAGGWGPASGGDDEAEYIPNRHVWVINNLFDNPAPIRTRDEHFVIFGPVHVPAGVNVPGPAASDDDLHIAGNVVWNGPADLPLGVEDDDRGCRPSHPTCSERQLRAQNTINGAGAEPVPSAARGGFRVPSGLAPGGAAPLPTLSDDGVPPGARLLVDSPHPMDALGEPRQSALAGALAR